jgi:carboxypeptidase T
MLTKRRMLLGGAAAVLALAVAWPAGAQQPVVPDQGLYEVQGADTTESRTEVARTGVDVLGVRDDTMQVVASPAQADELRAQGLALDLAGDWRAMLAERSGGPTRAADFPAGDEGYHTYDEMVAALQAAASAHPDITALSSLGDSYEGRDIPMIKISDNAATDEDEPRCCSPATCTRGSTSPPRCACTSWTGSRPGPTS